MIVRTSALLVQSEGFGDLQHPICFRQRRCYEHLTAGFQQIITRLEAVDVLHNFKGNNCVKRLGLKSKISPFVNISNNVRWREKIEARIRFYTKISSGSADPTRTSPNFQHTSGINKILTKEGKPLLLCPALHRPFRDNLFHFKRRSSNNISTPQCATFIRSILLLPPWRSRNRIGTYSQRTASDCFNTNVSATL